MMHFSTRLLSLAGEWPRSLYLSRQAVISAILLIALVAFELFNFDTTRFALTSLLGDVSFIGFGWATILAIAFCSIDFAGLAHLFSPDGRADEPQEAWYLMGAWLVGATLNALMTWWAVTLILLERPLGNEIVSRADILRWAPILIAALVWITRILFIGSLSLASAHWTEALPQLVQLERPVTAVTQPSRAAIGTQPTMTSPVTTPPRTAAPVVLKRQANRRPSPPPPNQPRVTVPPSPPATPPVHAAGD
ncbi:MAG TPA: hypothetical protein VLL52_24645 [Anaerolineae bacterium]|nr:hypothetical protein [Anaerolineae bacterium]